MPASSWSCSGGSLANRGMLTSRSLSMGSSWAMRSDTRRGSGLLQAVHCFPQARPEDRHDVSGGRRAALEEVHEVVATHREQDRVAARGGGLGAGAAVEQR